MQFQTSVPPTGKPLDPAPEIEVGRRVVSPRVEQFDRRTQVQIATHSVTEQEAEAAQAGVTGPPRDAGVRRALLPPQGGHLSHPAVGPTPDADALHAGEGYAGEVDLSGIDSAEFPTIHGYRQESRTQRPLYRVVGSAEPGGANGGKTGYQLGKKILEGHRVGAQDGFAVPLVRRPRPSLTRGSHLLSDLLECLFLRGIGQRSGQLALQLADQGVGGSFRDRPIRLLSTKSRNRTQAKYEQEPDFRGRP